MLKSTDSKVLTIYKLNLVLQHTLLSACYFSLSLHITYYEEFCISVVRNLGLLHLV